MVERAQVNLSLFVSVQSAGDVVQDQRVVEGEAHLYVLQWLPILSQCVVIIGVSKVG